MKNLRFLILYILLLFISLKSDFVWADNNPQTINIGIYYLLDFETGFNPFNSATVYHDQILQDVFDGFLSRSMMRRNIPGMAESWQVSEDNKEIIFNLNPQLKWSDGQPVIARDIQNGFKSLESLDYRIEIVSEYQVKFILNEDQKGILDKLSYYRHTAIPMHIVDKVGDDWHKPEHLVTNGPYKIDFSKSKEGEKIALVKNPHYWQKDMPLTPNINYIKVAKESDFARWMLKKELDLLLEVPPFQYKLLMKKIPEYIRVMPAFTACYLMVNHKKQHLQDIQFRKAIAHGIDRKSLIKSTGRQGLQESTTLIPNIMGYESSYHMDFNLDLAKAAIKTAGYNENNPASITLVSADTVSSKRLSSFVRGALSKLNIKVSPVFMEWNAAIDRFKAGNFDLGTYCWSPDRKSLSDFFAVVLPDLKDNHGKYTNQQVFDLWEKATLTSNEQDYFSYLAKAEEISLKEVGIIPLLRMSWVSVVHPQLEGFREQLRILYPIRELSWKSD